MLACYSQTCLVSDFEYSAPMCIFIVSISIFLSSKKCPGSTQVPSKMPAASKLAVGILDISRNWQPCLTNTDLDSPSSRSKEGGNSRKGEGVNKHTQIIRQVQNKEGETRKMKKLEGQNVKTARDGHIRSLYPKREN